MHVCVSLCVLVPACVSVFVCKCVCVGLRMCPSYMHVCVSVCVCLLAPVCVEGHACARAVVRVSPPCVRGLRVRSVIVRTCWQRAGPPAGPLLYLPAPEGFGGPGLGKIIGRQQTRVTQRQKG